MKTEKLKRQKLMVEKVNENPFLTDEELASMFGVSIHTIRFDRAELGIAEYRERIKNMAKGKYNNSPGVENSAEMLDITIMQNSVCVMHPNDGMTFEGSNMIKGQYIYAFAENVAINLIDEKSALVNVANLKYKKPVFVGDKLIAKTEVKRVKDNQYIVWVKISRSLNEVFRCKFILESVQPGLS